MQGFQGSCARNRLARVAIRDVSGGEGINATGVELTNGHTDCAGLIPQCSCIVFEGVRQCAALRSGQQYDQQQICR
jgi:hypothetical protein